MENEEEAQNHKKNNRKKEAYDNWGDDPRSNFATGSPQGAALARAGFTW